MTTLTDFVRGNINGDLAFIGPGGILGSEGDLLLFDDFGDKAIWLENGNGGRLATSPNGSNLPFTGPTWHIAAIADFDSSDKGAAGLGSSNPAAASDLLWVNDNGALALWQSTGSNVDPFAPNTFNQANLPNPGAGWHVASTNDFEREQLQEEGRDQDRKSTRLNSSHLGISYAVFCLKKKNTNE